MVGRIADVIDFGAVDRAAVVAETAALVPAQDAPSNALPIARQRYGAPRLATCHDLRRRLRLLRGAFVMAAARDFDMPFARSRSYCFGLATLPPRDVR